jgi:hypothetical protein
MTAGPLFSRVYNPLVDDFDAIVASANQHTLVGTTYFSATAIRLDFAPSHPAGATASVASPTKVVLPPYIAPPKKR